MSRFGNLEFDAEPSSTSSSNTRVDRDAGYWLTEANGAFAHGQFEPALRLFARVLEHDPQAAAAWAGQVRSLIELGEYREARLWADKSLERFPNDPELLAAKAVALARLGDVDDALAFSDASLEERGDTPYVWLARGDVLLARKENRADYCFERARAIGAGDWMVSWLAGRILHFYKRFAAALKFARDAVTLAPGEFTLWVLIGQCELELGLPQGARISFAQAQQLDPGNREAQAGLIALDRRGPLARIAGGIRGLFRS